MKHTLIARRLIGLVFLYTAGQKLANFESFVASVGTYSLWVPESLRFIMAAAVTAAELVIGPWLLAGVRPRQACLTAAGMLAGMFVLSVTQLASGVPAYCGCFYPGERLTWDTVLRQMGLIALLSPSCSGRSWKGRISTASLSLGVVLIVVSLAFTSLAPSLLAFRSSEAFAVSDDRWQGPGSGRKVVLYAMLSCELCHEVHGALVEYLMAREPQDAALAVRFVYEDKDSWDYHGAALALSLGASTDSDLFARFGRSDDGLPPNTGVPDALGLQSVEDDMRSANRLRIGSVPTIVVEGHGRPIVGLTPMYIVRQVDEALNREYRRQ